MGGDSGAGGVVEVVVDGGVQRGVVVPLQASISDGGG